MFNIGFGELAIILIVLIIAVGPERLPSMMKTLGKTLRTLRQASRDIRASTGIDELMREDFDLYAPIKPSPPRRPAPIPAPPEPAALPATAEAAAPTEPNAASDAEPKPVSRDEVIEGEDRPSVVVAPPPQAVGLPSDAPADVVSQPEPEPESAAPPTAAASSTITSDSPLPAASDENTVAPNGANPPAAPAASTGDTLPRAPIIQGPAAKPESQPEAAPKSSEPKQSGA